MIFQQRFCVLHKCPRGGMCTGKQCAGWRWFDPPSPEPEVIMHIDPLATIEPSERPEGVAF